MDPKKLLDNFSSHLKNTIARAISLASYLKQPQVDPIHLLVALSEERGSVAAEVMKKAGVKADELRQQAPLYHRDGVKTATQTTYQATMTLPDLSAAARQVLEHALLLAYNKKHAYIGTEHLLYSLMTGNHAEITAAIKATGAELASLKRAAENACETTGRFASLDDMVQTFSELSAAHSEQSLPTPLQSASKAKSKRERTQSAVEFFTINLTDPKVEKRIDPVIGREREIARLINILCRRTKNNPILIGEPGVGKTAIVEGLAKKIHSGDVPDILKHKKILALDLTLMIAGTIYRGEFEARLKQIIDEISNNPEFILFIDELHNIIGAGSNQGTLDAANILKPALARGQIRCIGATTLDEYKKYIASDPALERRFQSIAVEEPNREDTIRILSGIKKYYENFHHLTITDEALSAAVHLSTKYIHDQFQPDKSIDLVDESAAAVRVKQKTTKQEQKINELKEKIEFHKQKKTEALANELLEIALKHKAEITKLKTELTVLVKTKLRKADEKILPVVLAGDVLKTLADRLALDTSFLSLSEWEEIDRLIKRLKERIVGQDSVVDEVAGLLRRSYLGLRRGRRPLASLLFAGPSGVGKTEFAKVLAQELYHDHKSLIKLDMSEFAEPHSVSKLLGSPAGYVGYKDRNRFIDDIKKRPYSIILFDEIDKAHADVRKLLLQILDEGELSDSSGKKIHFQHAIVILTTNLGASLFKSSGIGFGQNKALADDATKINPELRARLTSLLKEELSSAIISRLDNICLFNPLGKDDVRKILNLQLMAMSDELRQAQKLSIAVDEAALCALVAEAFSPDLGARQVSQIIEKIVPELIVDILHKKSKHKQKYILTKKQEAYALI